MTVLCPDALPGNASNRQVIKPITEAILTGIVRRARAATSTLPMRRVAAAAARAVIRRTAPTG